MKDLNIEVPKGYVIDEDNSTFSKIVFKEKESDELRSLSKDEAEWIIANEPDMLLYFTDTYERLRDMDFEGAGIGSLQRYWISGREAYRDTDGMDWRYCVPIVDRKGIKRPHFGGQCPVSDDAKVMLYFRDGTKGYDDWCSAEDYVWTHSDGADYGSDIVAYIEL